MNKKMILKFFIDAAMIILMIILMGYRVTGGLLHEILGISLFVLFLLHCILNRKWFAHLPKMARNFKENKILLVWAITNILLIIDMVFLTVSSILISKEVFAGLGIMSGHSWQSIHKICAYGGFIIMSIHLGFHWNLIMRGVKNAFHIQGNNQLRNILLKGIVIVLIIMGVKASFEKNIASQFLINTNAKQAGGFAEGTRPDDFGQNQNKNGQVAEGPDQSGKSAENGKTQFNPEEGGAKGDAPISEGDNSLLSLFLDFIPIMALYAAGTYYTVKFVERKKKKEYDAEIEENEFIVEGEIITVEGNEIIIEGNGIIIEENEMIVENKNPTNE